MYNISILDSFHGNKGIKIILYTFIAWRNKMKRSTNYPLIITLITLLLTVYISCSLQKEVINNYDDEINCSVSIVPEATFVKKVAGNLVNVNIMIPPGNSPANYLPKPQELKQFNDSKIYFTIGVPAEQGILSYIKEMNHSTKVVNLAKRVSQVYPDREFAPGSRDPHIWLSPRRAKIIIQEIAKELSIIDSENKAVYEANAQKYISELDRLDTEIKEILKDLENKTFIVYHPAYGYFAEDYGLSMLCLEEDGKDIQIGNLTQIIEKAKKEGIKVIFYQAEIDSKKVEIFANEIEGKAMQLNPLSENYTENLKEIAKIFKKVVNNEE